MESYRFFNKHSLDEASTHNKQHLGFLLVYLLLAYLLRLMSDM